MVQPDQTMCCVMSLIYRNLDIPATIFTSCFFVCVTFVPHDISSVTSKCGLWAWLPD